MNAYLVQIDGFAGSTPVAVRLASHDDPALCHLDEQTWWPAIVTLPKLRYDFFDGAFGGGITTPTGQIAVQVDTVPTLPGLALHDARFRLWKGTLGDAFGAYTLLFDGRVQDQPTIADGVASINFSVDDGWLDQPLLATYAGTGGAEGPADLKGQVKQLLLGTPRFVEGTLVDIVNSVFQLSAYGAIEGFDQAFDRLSRFGAPVADATSLAALIALDIAPGAWATCLAGGYARFGAPPVGPVTFHVRGDAAATLGSPFAARVRSPGGLIGRIAQIAGAVSRVSLPSLAALNTAYPYYLSVVVNEQTTPRDLILRIASSVNAVPVVTWLGTLVVVPIGIGTPSLTLAADGTALPPVRNVRQVAVGAPFWRIAQQAERTYRVHALGDIAFDLTLVDRGAYDAGTSYREGDIVTIGDGSRFVFVGNSPATGSTPSDANANWSRMTNPVTGTPGVPGADGAPGAPGADGIIYYEWVAYADSPDGTLNFATGTPNGRTYQGRAPGKTTSTEGTNPADYTWSAYVGPPNFGLVAGANMVVSGARLFKNGGGYAWDSQVYSSESFTGGAYVSFRPEIADQMMIGLNTDPTTNADFNSIDHAIYISAAGYWDCRTNNGSTILFTGSGWVLGDSFALHYRGNAVDFKKNGVTHYTLAVAAGQTFWLDSSFAAQGHNATILAWAAAGAAGSDGANGSAGTDGRAVDLSAATVAVTADYLGNPKSGQLPRTVKATYLSGGTNVSGSTSWSIIYTSNCSVSVDGNGLCTISAATGPGSFIVRGSYGGTTIDKTIPITVTADPAPPTTADSGSTTQFNVTTGAYGTPTQGILTIMSSGSGTITYSLGITYDVAHSGGAKYAQFSAKAVYRLAGSGSGFSDMASETIGSDATWGPDGLAPGEPSFESGSVSFSGVKTGLSANTPYEVAFQARNVGSSAAVNLYGAGVASRS